MSLFSKAKGMMTIFSTPRVSDKENMFIGVDMAKDEAVWQPSNVMWQGSVSVQGGSGGNGAAGGAGGRPPLVIKRGIDGSVVDNEREKAEVVLRMLTERIQALPEGSLNESQRKVLAEEHLKELRQLLLPPLPDDERHVRTHAAVSSTYC